MRVLHGLTISPLSALHTIVDDPVGITRLRKVLRILEAKGKEAKASWGRRNVY